MEDLYKILEISKDASEEDIKRAYRRLAHEYHPDKASGNEKKFKEINEAYQVLSNKEKRAQYDRFGRTFAGGGGQAGGQGPGGFGFGGFSAGGGSPFGGDFDQSGFSDMGDLSDLFESFFGSMGGKRRKTYTRGSDLQINQEITLEEAYRGVQKEIRFKAYTVCGDCGGLGYFAKEGVKTCLACNGRGEVKEVRNTFFGSFQQVRTCTKCNGAGEIPHKPCTICKGAGRVMRSRTLTLDILPGVADGQLIKMTGAGETGERNAPAGDLYVQVRIVGHPVFRRVQSDIFIKKTVSLVDVLRNKPVEIPLISGESMSIEIPAGFNLSEKLRISGKGMPHFNSRGAGDLYIEFDVRTPKKLSSKAKKLLDDLGEEIS